MKISQTKVFNNGYILLRLKNGSKEYYSPDGVMTVKLEGNKGMLINKSGMQSGIMKYGDYYYNFINGVVYKK